MKYIASLFLIRILCQGISGGRTQLDTSIYSFKITGTVVFKKHQSPAGATVYLTWGNGPIEGRIPAWVHANKDGTFIFEFNNSADVYHVCAHPGQTNGLLPLVPPEKAQNIHIKTVCSDFRLDGQHLQRDVQLKLK
jgi:hypothetical protein